MFSTSSEASDLYVAENLQVKTGKVLGLDENYADTTCVTEFGDESVRRLFQKLCTDQSFVISISEVKSQVQSMMAGVGNWSDSHHQTKPSKDNDNKVDIKEWINAQKMRKQQPPHDAACVVSWDTKVGPSSVLKATHKASPMHTPEAANAVATQMPTSRDEEFARDGEGPIRAAQDDGVIDGSVLGLDVSDADPALPMEASLPMQASGREAGRPHADAEAPQGRPTTAADADWRQPAAAARAAAARCGAAASSRTPPAQAAPADRAYARSEFTCPSALAAARALAADDYEAAGRICSAMIQAREACFPAWYIRAESFRLRGLPADAADDYGFCLAIDAASARAHKGRGLCLLDMGRFAQAAMHLRRARALLPAADSVVCVSLGRCYEELGDITGALREYDEAIGSDASSAYALFCRGCCLRCIGEEERAGEDLAQVLRLDPLFASRYVRAAAEAEETGRLEAAADMYRSLEELPVSREQLCWLRDRRAQLSAPLRALAEGGRSGAG